MLSKPLILAIIWMFEKCAFADFNLNLEFDGPSLIEAYKNHKGFMIDKWEQYLYIYDREFSMYRKNCKSIQLLEFGVYFGGSLQLWKAYFGKDAVISGVDIDDRVCIDAAFEKDIFVDCFDVLNSTKLVKYFEGKKFDIIIDEFIFNGEYVLYVVVPSY